MQRCVDVCVGRHVYGQIPYILHGQPRKSPVGGHTSNQLFIGYLRRKIYIERHEMSHPNCITLLPSTPKYFAELYNRYVKTFNYPTPPPSKVLESLFGILTMMIVYSVALFVICALCSQFLSIIRSVPAVMALLPHHLKIFKNLFAKCFVLIIPPVRYFEIIFPHHRSLVVRLKAQYRLKLALDLSQQLQS